MSVFIQIIEGKVVSSFAGPQDVEVWPGTIEVDETDQRYIDFTASMSPSIEALARTKMDQLLTVAALRIAPLQDAVDIDEATPAGVELLKKWKKYRSNLGKVETISGWPKDPQWPTPPVPL